MGASVHGSRERLLDRGACELETEALVAIVLQGVEVDSHVLVLVSRWIGNGGAASGGVRPEDIVGSGLTSIDAGIVLAAAFELARRGAEPRAPEVIRGPADVAAIAHRELGGLRRERVLVIVCDAANRPTRTVVVSDGAIDRALLPLREILNAVLRWDGRAFAVAHNHPGGDPGLSDADVAATQQIEQAARIVGLRFLGHVAAGAHRWAEISRGVPRIPG